MGKRPILSEFRRIVHIDWILQTTSHFPALFCFWAHSFPFKREKERKIIVQLQFLIWQAPSHFLRIWQNMISHLTFFLILPLGKTELNQTPLQSLSWLKIHTYSSSYRLFSAATVDSEKNNQKAMHLPSRTRLTAVSNSAASLLPFNNSLQSLVIHSFNK